MGSSVTHRERAAAQRRGRRAPHLLTAEHAFAEKGTERAGRLRKHLTGVVHLGWRKTCGAVTMQTCE